MTALQDEALRLSPVVGYLPKLESFVNQVPSANIALSIEHKMEGEY